MKKMCIESPDDAAALIWAALPKVQKEERVFATV